MSGRFSIEFTPTPRVEQPAKAGTCGACKWWTPAHDNYVSTCHNLEAGIGAHTQSERDSRCNYHEPADG